MKRIDKIKQLPLEQALEYLFGLFHMKLEEDDCLKIVTNLIHDEISCENCFETCDATNMETCYNKLKQYLLEEYND